MKLQVWLACNPEIPDFQINDRQIQSLINLSEFLKQKIEENISQTLMSWEN